MSTEARRVVVWAAGLGVLCGCGLLAPFDLGALPAAADGDSHEDADSGADSDVDGERDADGDPADGAPGDAEADHDEPAWDPLAGCVGGETEERWLVVEAVPGGIRSVVTDRDCSDPVPLCDGCAAMAFSPSGDRAVAILLTDEIARVHDEIVVLDVETRAVVHRGFFGALPVWLDDDTLLYVAADDRWRGTCKDVDPLLRPPVEEVVVLRRRELASGRDEPVVDSVRGGWTTCCPVVSAEAGAVLYAVDLATTCERTLDAVEAASLATGEHWSIEWTVDERRNAFDAPVGVLPDGTGVVLQTGAEEWELERSVIYATRFDGVAKRLIGPFWATLDLALPGSVAPGYWAHCATVRRLGPACEVYCHELGGYRWVRHRLTDDTTEPVDCSELGEEIRIMDVRQVPRASGLAPRRIGS